MNSAFIKKITAVLIAIVLIISGIVVYFTVKSNDLTTDISKMITKAKEFRQSGDNDNAYYQLEMYIHSTTDNYDACMLMGDWYAEDENEVNAEKYYNKAVFSKKYSENDICAADGVSELNCSVENVELEIKPAAKYTRDVVLKIYDGNLATGKTVTGRIKNSESERTEDEDCACTEWFDIKNGCKKLTLTGTINCAVWQFCDSDNVITPYIDQGIYRQADSVSFKNCNASTVTVPDEAIKARVMYYDASVDKSLKNTNDICITYGSIASGYNALGYQEIKLPDILQGESLIYKNGIWSLKKTSDNNEENLEEIKIDKIKTSYIGNISISGALCGYITVSKEEAKVEKGDKSLVYGIKYKHNGNNIASRRTYDAIGMNFDYKTSDGWVNGTGNDFDNAYPWSEMKLCNVSVKKDGSQDITYCDSEKFAADGSNGNVMVEIPKFYVKRTVADGYEQICISGKKYNGFALEPVFLNSDGSEAEKVYMSAYIGSLSNGKIQSVSGAKPVIGISYEEALDRAKENGRGYSEMSWLMLSALQKLFIVEVGNIDSSSVFSGQSELFYYYTDSKIFALEDAKNSNIIKLEDNYNTKKIIQGSEIIVFEGWDSYSSKTEHRIVESVTFSDKVATIKFSGEPVNIVKGKTVVTNIASKSGATDNFEYGTSVSDGINGTGIFKYRGIENLYGGLMIMLDKNAWINNGYFSYEDSTGYIHKLYTSIAEQTEEISSYGKNYESMCISSMTYDEEYPLVMMPSSVKGANAFSGYGDFWYYKNDGSYTNKYIVYGGAENSMRMSGLFHMRAILNEDSRGGSIYSARIIYKNDNV